MTFVVLDTNVLASGFVRGSKDSAPVLIMDAWREELFELVISAPILSELAATLSSPYFKRHLTNKQVTADLDLLLTEAIVVPITAQVHGVATHPEDDLILATAVSCNADYLVTGDRRLQKIREYKGVAVLNPRSFMDTLYLTIQG